MTKPAFSLKTKLGHTIAVWESDPSCASTSHYFVAVTGSGGRAFFETLKDASSFAHKVAQYFGGVEPAHHRTRI